MERGQGQKSDQEWDRQMDEMVDLVKFTKDKDIFKEFYINQLAKRLLSGRSASNEDEIKMVKKLQHGGSMLWWIYSRLILLQNSARNSRREMQ